MSQAPIVYDSQGSIVPLGRSLGVGGEGTVYEVLGDPARVVKLYHTPVDAERTEKLRALCQLRTDALQRLAAWPIDTLSGPRGHITGLSMPRVSGKPIHLLYGPRSRRKEFPQADWTFLLHAATNLARAFAVVHEHGHVLGDVNHENARVTDQAMIRLIDCDSFQITWNDRTFLCGVGVSTHVPPELQAGSLRVRRTANHDLFGLAVLIFQLLFLGRHPFSGKHAGPGEISLEEAVQGFRFAYKRSAAARLQPPNTPGLWVVSEEVATFFERAFARSGAQDGARPSARAWVHALEAIRLVTCALHGRHTYLSSLPHCPWCEIERSSGIMFFRPARTGKFNLEGVWSQIVEVLPPAPQLPVPAPGVFPISPSAAALRKARRLKLQKLTLLGLMFAAYTPMFLDSSSRTSDPGTLMILLFLAIPVACAYGIKALETRARQSMKPAVWEARSRFDALTARWQTELPNSSFQDRFREAEELRRRYIDLQGPRQRRNARLAPPEPLDAQKGQIESGLLSALDDLRRMARPIIERRNALQAEIEVAARAVAQAEIDLKMV